MKTILAGLFLCCLLAACDGENSYERQSESDEMKTSDTVAGGLQTGAGTESVAAPNAANTKRTPVPLEPVTVDTSNSPDQR